MGFGGYKRALSAVRLHQQTSYLPRIHPSIPTTMIAQILLLVIATAACVNAYPQGAELAQDLASFLDQLQTAESQNTGRTVKLQQSLSLCSPFPFYLTFNGVTYEFRDCIVMGAVCQYNQGVFPPTCQFSTFGCYDIEWITNGNGIQRFKMCPAAGGACIQNFSLMRCGDKIEERAQQQNIRLCQENPDGTENCAGDEKAVQQDWGQECFCLIGPDNHSYCEPQNCEQAVQQDWGQECFCIASPNGDRVCEPRGCHASIMA